MKRDVTITSMPGDIVVPVSKSVLHRELIISFLLLTRSSDPSPELISSIITPGDNDNKDIIATRACLKALYEAGDGDVIMPCNESGSTLRFMMSISVAYMRYKGLNGRIVFKPQGRLIERPLDQLVACLASHGVTTVIDKERGEIVLTGTPSDGEFQIEGNISSQYISGLLMALIMMPDSSVRLMGNLESEGYFELTIAAMRSKEIKVLGDGTYKIELPGGSLEHVDIECEGDWSGAAFLISLAAILRDTDVRFRGLKETSGQKDKVIVEILGKMGVTASFKDGVLSIDKIEDVKPVLELDASDWPDIVPYVAVLAACFTEETTIRNIGRLRFKECDRVKATIEALSGVGAIAREDSDCLIIEGGIREDRNDDFCTYNDHRMAQTACLISAWTGKTIRIDNAECVDKSFPGLWELLDEGGKS